MNSQPTYVAAVTGVLGSPSGSRGRRFGHQHAAGSARDVASLTTWYGTSQQTRKRSPARRNLVSLGWRCSNAQHVYSTHQYTLHHGKDLRRSTSSAWSSTQRLTSRGVFTSLELGVESGSISNSLGPVGSERAWSRVDDVRRQVPPSLSGTASGVLHVRTRGWGRNSWDRCTRAQQMMVSPPENSFAAPTRSDARSLQAPGAQRNLTCLVQVAHDARHRRARPGCSSRR
jgi:hypothetical protein